MSNTEDPTHMVKTISDSSFKSIKMNAESESDLTLKGEEEVKTGLLPIFPAGAGAHMIDGTKQKTYLSSDFLF